MSKTIIVEAAKTQADVTNGQLGVTPILDSLRDPSGNSIGEMARGALTTLIGHALGRVYWRNAADARSSGDAIAAEYWMTEAIKNMSHADKRRNFVA